jgi:hypothetical protein
MHHTTILDMIHGYVADPVPSTEALAEAASYVACVPASSILDATGPGADAIEIAMAAADLRREHGYSG